MDSTSCRLLFSRCLAAALLAVTLAFTGCTLCQDCGDLDYPTYGGAWERTRRDSGRVGSVFDPAGGRSATLTDRDATTDDSPLRKPSESTDSTGLDEEASGPRRDDDPRDQPEPAPGRGNDSSPSASDRDLDPEAGPNSDSLRELELDDISVERGELLPPGI